MRALSVTGCFAVLASGCAPPPATSTTSSLVALHQPARVSGSRVVGHVPADTVIELVLGLKLRDPDGLRRLLARQKNPAAAEYRHYLSPASFADSFAPQKEAYAQLVSALEEAGFKVTRTVDGRTSISISGPAALVEHMFGTELLVYEDDRTRIDLARFYAPTASFAISDAVDQFHLIDSVTGLDDANRWLSHRVDLQPVAPNALPAGSADPLDIRGLYGVTGALHPVTHQQLQGAGETIALLGTGYPPEAADIKNFISHFSLPTDSKAQYTQVLLGGPNRDPDALAANEYQENVLDADMILGVAPLANVVHVHVATNQPGLFADGVSFIVNQVPQAHAVSLSYGSCEAVAIYEVLQLNSLYQQAQAEGQAWFVASGDDGTDACKDGSKNGVPSVDWPSSSPYVFGVGGTQLSDNDEVVWGGSGGGGGGQSAIIVKPSWQEGVGPYPDDGVREVPDVAALAGSPGVSVVFGTQLNVLNGTSAAAPIWGAIWALLDEARGNIGMSDYHERIYALGKLHSPALHDIVDGSNFGGATSGYPAAPGFDLATGWGTPNLISLVGALP